MLIYQPCSLGVPEGVAAGAQRRLADGQEDAGRADLLELRLLARVQQDHGQREVEGDPQAVHHLLTQVLAEGHTETSSYLVHSPR